jgi:hypothetical protein
MYEQKCPFALKTKYVLILEVLIDLLAKWKLSPSKTGLHGKPGHPQWDSCGKPGISEGSLPQDLNTWLPLPLSKLFF